MSLSFNATKAVDLSIGAKTEGKLPNGNSVSAEFTIDVPSDLAFKAAAGKPFNLSVSGIYKQQLSNPGGGKLSVETGMNASFTMGGGQIIPNGTVKVSAGLLLETSHETVTPQNMQQKSKGSFYASLEGTVSSQGVSGRMSAGVKAGGENKQLPGPDGESASLGPIFAEGKLDAKWNDNPFKITSAIVRGEQILVPNRNGSGNEVGKITVNASGKIGIVVPVFGIPTVVQLKVPAGSEIVFEADGKHVLRFNNGDNPPKSVFELDVGKLCLDMSQSLERTQKQVVNHVVNLPGVRDVLALTGNAPRAEPPAKPADRLVYHDTAMNYDVSKQIKLYRSVESGHIFPIDDTGKRFRPYDPGTKTSAIASSLADERSQLYLQGSYLKPKILNDVDAFRAGKPISDPLTRVGTIENWKTLRSLDVYQDKNGTRIVLDQNGKEWGRYGSNKTLDQIQDTMDNVRSPMYGQGRRLSPEDRPAPEVTNEYQFVNNGSLGKPNNTAMKVPSNLEMIDYAYDQKRNRLEVWQAPNSSNVYARNEKTGIWYGVYKEGRDDRHTIQKIESTMNTPGSNLDGVGAWSASWINFNNLRSALPASHTTGQIAVASAAIAPQASAATDERVLVKTPSNRFLTLTQGEAGIVLVSAGDKKIGEMSGMSLQSTQKYLAVVDHFQNQGEQSVSNTSGTLTPKLEERAPRMSM